MRENVDAWSARQSDEPGRSEAIRRLVELGLASVQRTGARTNKAAKASELAGQEIDRLGDPSATDEEVGAEIRVAPARVRVVQWAKLRLA